MYIEEAGEGTSPILSFLDPIVKVVKEILLKVTLSIKAAREAQNSPDVYAYLLFFVTMITASSIQ